VGKTKRAIRPARQTDKAWARGERRDGLVAPKFELHLHLRGGGRKLQQGGRKHPGKCAGSAAHVAESLRGLGGVGRRERWGGGDAKKGENPAFPGDHGPAMFWGNEGIRQKGAS